MANDGGAARRDLLTVGLAPLFVFGRASRGDLEVVGSGQNEKTPKVNQGPFKERLDWFFRMFDQ
jgi:hypothetical protein